MGPRRTLLRVQPDEVGGDQIGLEDPVLSQQRLDIGANGARKDAVDGAVHHDMRHVNPLGGELARGALRNRAQSRLGRCKRGEAFASSE